MVYLEEPFSRLILLLIMGTVGKRGKPLCSSLCVAEHSVHCFFLRGLKKARFFESSRFCGSASGIIGQKHVVSVCDANK